MKQEFSTSKTCYKCKSVKNPSDFAKGQSWCKACKHEYSLEYYARPYVKARQSQHSKHHQSKSPRHGLLIRLIKGIKRKPTENPITIDEMMQIWENQNGKCVLTGMGMVWGGDGNGHKKMRPNSVSIDRIDNNMGYEKTNVRLICNAVNAFKGAMTDKEMLEMARLLVDRSTGILPK